MTALQPLTSQDLLHIEKRNTPSILISLLIALVIGAAAFLASFPQGGPLMLIGLGVALVILIAWWWKLRSQGKRFNNYDPMKTDDELARTPNSSPEQQRLMFLQLFVLAAVFGSRMFQIPGYPVIVGVVVFLLAAYLLISGGAAPASYKKINMLLADKDVQLQKNNEWLLAYLYAHRIMPAGYQWRSDSLEESAKAYGFQPKSIKKALDALVHSGQVAKIRELRSIDGSVTWVTLTDKGVEAALKLLA